MWCVEENSEDVLRGWRCSRKIKLTVKEKNVEWLWKALAAGFLFLLQSRPSAGAHRRSNPVSLFRVDGGGCKAGVVVERTPTLVSGFF